MSTFQLSGTVAVDTRRAVENVRSFKGELGQAHSELVRLNEQAAKGVGLKSLESAARENRKRISAEVQLIREKSRVEKAEIASVTRAAKGATQDRARAEKQAASEAAKATTAQFKAERKAISDSAQAQKQAAAQAERDNKAALQRQKAEGAAAARQIEAEWRRNGVTVNRFGESVSTVTGLLKNSNGELKKIGADTRDIRLSFKVDPRGDLGKVRDEIRAAQKAAGALEVDLNGDKARAELESLLKPLAELKEAAKIQVTVSDGGAIKKASITSGAGSGGGGGPPDAAEGGAGAIADALEKAKSAREELWQKVSDLSSLAGAGILGGLGLATKTAIDFEAALRNANSVAHLSEKQFANLNKEVMRLSSDPNITKGPVDLAAALYDIYSSGFQGKQALAILRDSAIGAGAGLTDTATSSRVLMAVLNSGIKGVSNSKQAIDVLFQTVNKGALNFEQLAGTLGAVLPTASKAGLSIQEVGAAIAVMTLGGQSASEATNDFLNLLTKLLNPSKEAAKAFDALGIKYGFAAMQAKGLPAILDEIGQKTKGQGDVIAKLLPDMQASRGVLALLKTTGQTYASILPQMSEVGAAQRSAAEQAKSTAVQIQKQAASFELLRIQVGQKLLPNLNKLLEKGNSILNWFNNLKGSTQDSIVKWTTYAGVALLLGGRVKGLVDTFILLRTAMYTARVATAAETTATVANTTATTVATGATGRFAAMQGILAAAMARARAVGVAAMGALRMAIASVYGQIALVLVAIGGFAVAFYGARDAGTMSADALIEKWGALGQIWVAGGDALGNILTKLDLDGNNAAGDAAERARYELNKKSWAKQGKPIPTFEQFQAGLGAGQTQQSANAAQKARELAAQRKKDAARAKAEAAKQKAELDRILKQIDDATRRASGKKSPEEKAAAAAEREQKKVQAAAKREQLRLAREAAQQAKSEAQSATDATRQFASNQGDALGDAATAWRDYGRTVEEVADKQIEKLRATRDGVAGLVQSIEAKLIESGTMTPKVAKGFYGQVAKIDQSLSPALLQSIYDNSRRTSASATLKAAGYEAQKERLAGQDGAVAVGNRSGGAMAMARSGDLHVAENLVEGMARGINTPKGLASCAAFSGALLTKLGISIERNNVAGQLAKNAQAMGARRIPLSEASQGDLLVMNGPREGKIKDSRGWGTHVGVSAGRGKMWDSSGNGPNHQRFGNAYTPKIGEAYALDTSVLSRFAGAGSIGAQGSGAQNVNLPKVSGEKSTPRVRPALAAARSASSAVRGQTTDALLAAYVAAEKANDAAGEKGNNARAFKALEAKFAALEALYKKRGLPVEQLMRDIQRAKTGKSASANKNSGTAKSGLSLAPRTAPPGAASNAAPVVSEVERPDFGKGLAKYAVSGLKGYFPNARATDYNANRRDASLALAELSPQLHTFAARKGLTGKASQAWVKEQRDAITALATYGDATATAAKDVEKLREAEQKRGDVLRAGREDLNAQTRAARAEIYGVTRGKTDEQIDRAAQSTERLTKRFKEFREASFSYDRSLQLAREEEGIRAVNQGYADMVKFLREATLSAGEVGEAIGNASSMREMAGKAEDALRGALATPKTDVDALREALSQVPPDLQAILDSATAAGKGGKVLLAKYAPLVDLLAKARGELGTRDRTERARPDREAREERDARLGQISAELDSRSKMARIFDEAGRARAQLRQDIESQGGFSDAQISAILNQDAWISKTEKIGDALHGIFKNSFSNIEGGFSGMWSSVMDGTRQWLTQMAAEVLSSWVMNQVFGALLGGLGGAPGGVGGFAGGGVDLKGGGSGGFSLGSAVKTVGGLGGGGLLGRKTALYTGLNRVPRDEFPALLHQDEAVLTARQAKEWRAMNLSTMRGSGEGDAPGARAGAAPRGGGTIIEQHFHAPVTIQANDTGEMQEKLAGAGDSLPRRETQRQARRALGF